MTTSTPSKRILSTTEVAKLLGASEGTVRKAAHEGGLRVGDTRVQALFIATRIVWPIAPFAAFFGCEPDDLLAA